MINHVLEEAGARSVIILSTPRSGSTYLGQAISNKLDCDFFSEPSRPRNNRMKEFFFHANLNKRFVLKEHTLMYMKNYINIFDKNDFFFIRLRRKNILKQILSSYISNQRQNWFYNKSHFKNDNISLNQQQLIDTCEYIKKFNMASEIYKGRVDFDLYFEDLKFDHSISLPSLKPDNYHELNVWAKDILKNKL